MADEPIPRSYEVKIRILGNEIFYISLATNDNSNRWMAIGLATMFMLLVIAGAYGEKLISLYKQL